MSSAARSRFQRRRSIQRGSSTIFTVPGTADEAQDDGASGIRTRQMWSDSEEEEDIIPDISGKVEDKRRTRKSWEGQGEASRRHAENENAKDDPWQTRVQRAPRQDMVDSDDIVAVDVVSSSIGWRRGQRPSQGSTQASTINRDETTTRSRAPPVTASPSDREKVAVRRTLGQDATAALQEEDGAHQGRAQLMDVRTSVLASTEPEEMRNAGTSNTLNENAIAQDQSVPMTATVTAVMGDSSLREEPTSDHSRVEKTPRTVVVQGSTAVRVDDSVGTTAGSRDVVTTPSERSVSVSKPPEEQLGVDYCRFCGRKAEVQLCSKCISVSYCSAKCQSSDWPRHKKLCHRLTTEKAAQDRGSHAIFRPFTAQGERSRVPVEAKEPDDVHPPDSEEVVAGDDSGDVSRIDTFVMAEGGDNGDNDYIDVAAAANDTVHDDKDDIHNQAEVVVDTEPDAEAEFNAVEMVLSSVAAGSSRQPSVRPNDCDVMAEAPSSTRDDSSESNTAALPGVIDDATSTATPSASTAVKATALLAMESGQADEEAFWEVVNKAAPRALSTPTSRVLDNIAAHVPPSSTRSTSSAGPSARSASAASEAKHTPPSGRTPESSTLQAPKHGQLVDGGKGDEAAEWGECFGVMPGAAPSEDTHDTPDRNNAAVLAARSTRLSFLDSDDGSNIPALGGGRRSSSKAQASQAQSTSRPDAVAGPTGARSAWGSGNDSVLSPTTKAPDPASFAPTPKKVAVAAAAKGIDEGSRSSLSVASSHVPTSSSSSPSSSSSSPSSAKKAAASVANNRKGDDKIHSSAHTRTPPTSNTVRHVEDRKITKLHEAANTGNLALLKKLVGRKEYPIDVPDREGRTPLMHAVHRHHFPCVAFLLSKGANVNLTADDGASALHEACYNSTLAIVQLLLRNGADPSAVDQDGRQPVHWATDNPFGPRAMCILIENHGVDVNTVDDSGMTPLMWAACHDQAPMVNALRDLGADLMEKDVDGKTAMDWAVNKDSCAVLEMIVSHASTFFKDRVGRTVLHTAAERGAVHAIEYILTIRPDAVNDEDKMHRTPLFWAAACNEIEAASTLLAMGADVTRKDNKGLTATDYAVVKGHIELAELIDAHQTNVSQHGEGSWASGGVGNATRDIGVATPIKQSRSNPRSPPAMARSESLVSLYVTPTALSPRSGGGLALENGAGVEVSPSVVTFAEECVAKGAHQPPRSFSLERQLTDRECLEIALHPRGQSLTKIGGGGKGKGVQRFFRIAVDKGRAYLVWSKSRGDLECFKAIMTAGITNTDAELSSVDARQFVVHTSVKALHLVAADEAHRRGWSRALHYLTHGDEHSTA